MLNTSFRFDTLGYDLELRRCSEWKQSKERLLIVLQTVETADLKAGALASTPTLVNCIKYARQEARKWGPIPEFAYAVINFNDKKHLHTKGSPRRNAEDEFRARCQSLIERLNPTRILISGDLNILYPLPDAADKNGWVHEFDNRKVTSTLDLNSLTEKDGQQANLLGFWCRDLANLMLGRLPYSVKDLVNKPVYVGTIERFNKMLKLFPKSEMIALDTETRNLSVTSNKIYTAQFCFDARPELGFVIPVDHPKTPFTPDEIKYIKSKLREQLDRKDNYFIMFNGMFDLRVSRACLNMPIIRAPVWEITAGEHHLDENISSLPSLGIRSGNLRATLCRYGNDHYYKSAFGKEDRNSTGSRDPDDPDFLEYRVWKYLKPRDGGISDGYVFSMARQYGWQDSAAEDFDVVPYTPKAERFDALAAATTPPPKPSLSVVGGTDVPTPAAAHEFMDASGGGAAPPGKPAPPPKPFKFKLEAAHTLRDLPPMEWIIKGVKVDG